MSDAITYGSVCSGIEAATVAWDPLGFKPQWFSEIEKFPSALLEQRYPHVPNLGDMTEIKNDARFTTRPLDLLVGGTPCQAFSVGGFRKGLADPRGNLALEYLALADMARPRWVVWENVAGVLDSNGGRDFGSFLGALGKLGYGWSYRVLDSQYFGVAQRRRRVFVVGHLGTWAPAAGVLFDGAGAKGTSPPVPTLNPTGARFFMPGNRARDHEWPETLAARDYKDPQVVINEGTIRRLTPVEYERLQGFPDDYTRINWRGRGEDKCPNGPRYKALGNSMAVPVMRWIGERIKTTDAILKEQGHGRTALSA